MKSKKLNNKLSLNKKTIANLEVREMNYAKGGATRVTECHPICDPPPPVPTFEPLCETIMDTWCDGQSYAFCETQDGGPVCPLE
jgi:natural product precursor